MESYMFFIGMNVWFLYNVPNPGLVRSHVKQAMKLDGYWDDCDMTDAELSDGIHYLVPEENMLKFETVYKSLGDNWIRENESWACYETMMAIAKEFHV